LLYCLYTSAKCKKIMSKKNKKQNKTPQPAIEAEVEGVALADGQAPYQVWGKNQIDPAAIAQLERSTQLPVSVRAALMPDAHVGYGLPIGGVLATRNAVIPYAVGVDIACRMRLSIFEASPYALEQKREKFRRALQNNTRFGTGVVWETPHDHPVMSDPLWAEHPIARSVRETARAQLGSSGSGNHFAEFGAIEVTTPFVTEQAEIPPGKYLALLTHSGSRRLGYQIANHYTAIAMHRWGGLPTTHKMLAWLDLDSGVGAEYWAGMQLAGAYASACHEIIHNLIANAVKLEVRGVIENHHNFAWQEQIDGETLIVHRKGATPAGPGVMGVIPGSMGAPGFVVRGLGNPLALNSASHGAGRKLNRREAAGRYDWNAIQRHLKGQGIEVLAAGDDELPGAYKNIHEVMKAQQDLVESVAEFSPKMVLMDAGRRRGGGGEE
jgi:tRNA-splicing ligase RtcB (3'-phosphate/5'-hydroxy nucleic acid ligase)